MHRPDAPSAAPSPTLLAELQALAPLVEALEAGAVGAADPGAEALARLERVYRQAVLPEIDRRARLAARAGDRAHPLTTEQLFLANEVTELLGALARLGGEPAGDGAYEPPGATSRALAREAARRHHRIVAVLELAALREESLAAPPDAARSAEPAPPPEAPAASEIRPLGVGESRRLLERIGWGILATESAGQPYAVPVAYGFDGERIFVGIGPGKKARQLEANPRVCLTVAEVPSFAAWRSVVVTGVAQPVKGLADRLAAIDALRRQRRPAGAPRISDASRLLGARFIRIEIAELTGRARGHPPDA
ncbi:MAG TPA: pyridoxamine 5'-phosphate oxidase family protein [Gemmatimonadales bacterium]|nr:pyridoxamine 5'-phosphate oxidase family protein [Gemmatimonadales bacterium]